MKQIKWVLMNGLLACALWFGLVEGVRGALNVGLVMVWWVVVCSLVTVRDDFRAKAAQSDKFPSIPPALDGAFDTCIAVLILWHGYIITGVAWAISAVLHGCLYDAVKELRAKANNDLSGK